MMINDLIPDFEVDAYDNGEIKKIKLSNCRGKWVILLFYPADFTFVCPTELKEAADNYEKIKSLGGEVMSISTDTVFAHKVWHDNSATINEIKYPMLSDPAGKVSKLFNVYSEEQGFALRGTFLIDPNGFLKTMEVHDNGIGRNFKETVRKLEAAKFIWDHPNNVCPAGWTPDKPALTTGSELIGKI